MTMHRMPWSEVKQRLHGAPAGRGSKDREEFWADFKARARCVRQAQPETLPGLSWRALSLRWSAGLTAVAAILLAVLLLPHGGTVAGNRIRSLQVIASHTGVMILNDTSGKGTILWVAGLETGAPNGG